MPKGFPKSGINRGWFKDGVTTPKSLEHRKKIGLANSRALKGRKLSEEHKLHIKLGMAGQHQDSNNPGWKGNQVKYMGLHNWIRRKLGKPSYCEHCGNSEPTAMYHWANKTGRYLRDINDWLRLCVRCHKLYDGK